MRDSKVDIPSLDGQVPGRKASENTQHLFKIYMLVAVQEADQSVVVVFKITDLELIIRLTAKYLQNDPPTLELI